jgi:6-phosphogluconolactonase
VEPEEHGDSGDHRERGRDLAQERFPTGRDPEMMGRLRPSALALIVAGIAFLLAACGTTDRREIVYVGTYTDGASRGIYRFELDPATGETTRPVLAGSTDNPSFLALHPNGRVLYAVNELASFQGRDTGAVSSFSIDPATGGLTLVGQEPSGGTDPCHLVVDHAGRHALVANYSSGSVEVLPLAADGGLGAPTSVIPQAGSGPNAARQAGPHTHSILLDPAERFAFAANLGADRIFVYRFDAGSGALEPVNPGGVPVAPGSGPRHLAWHPSGRFLYLISELASTLTCFRYDAAAGTLEAIQTVTTLPEGFAGTNTAAELVVSADGRFLYASNRGADSVAVFSIDGATGRIVLREQAPAGGKTPRHFAIDPSGRWMLVANQGSDGIAIFDLEPATGRPRTTGRTIEVSKQVCVLFAPQPPRH